MRRKLSLITMLVAWLLATGSHWDLVQTFAWGRMLANYSQTMPLAQAVKLTFTPDNLCGLCESVSEAKQQQDAALPSDGTGFGKIPLVCQPVPSLIGVSSSGETWALCDLAPTGRERHPPPVPPPQTLV